MNKVIFSNKTGIQYKQLKNAVSKDKNRPHLTAVYLDMQYNQLAVTDCYIMMLYDIEVLNVEGEFTKDILIDPKIFNQANWLSVPKDDLGLVEFHVTEEKTEVFLGEDVVAVAKNIESEQQYPNFRHVLTNNKEQNTFCISADVLKRFVCSLPNGFDFPKINVGSKLSLKITSEHHDYGDMSVEGIAMTTGFGEDELTNETIEIKINRDGNGKVFSGESAKVLGKRLSRNVINSWDEDFADEDMGEVVAITRNEIIAEKGTIVTAEVFERISTYKNIEYVFILKYDN